MFCWKMIFFQCLQKEKVAFKHLLIIIYWDLFYLFEFLGSLFS